MNAEKKDQMKNNGTWKAMHDFLSIEVPENLEKKLKKALNFFRQDMREHPYVRRPERHRFLLRRYLGFSSRPWARPFLLAGMGLILVLVAGF